MGKLEDIEARLERLERPCSVPQMTGVMTFDLVRQRDAAFEQQVVEREGRHRAERKRDEWKLTTERLVKERDEARASVDQLRGDNERFLRERGEARLQLDATLAAVQAEFPGIKWGRDSTAAVLEAIGSLKTKLADMEHELRDVEERAESSLRLWQEFSRKLDEKYPGRTRNEGPCDYALRLLDVGRKTIDRLLAEREAEKE